MQNNISESLINLDIKARQLLTAQLGEWKLAFDGYQSLNSVQSRSFEYDGFNIKLQFNPGRMVSSAAKVDAKSISERPCFLCKNNLPKEQRGIDINNKYLLLVNPFPIFPQHFTIPLYDHKPQLIYNYLDDMLDIAAGLNNSYTLFYNGPKCGASAPDHMHFQAGLTGFMPVDNEIDKVLEVKGEILFNKDNTKLYAVNNYLRNLFVIKSDDKTSVKKLFEIIYGCLQPDPESNEPMMNILCRHVHNTWQMIIIPRIKHRPSQFFADGEHKILLSPASVDLGGVCILPREEDYLKITKDDITDIFSQIVLCDKDFAKLKETAGNKIISNFNQG